MLMAGVDHRDACAEVDIALAILAPYFGVLGFLCVNRGGVAYAARYRILTADVKLG
jgi:hypothetical protein